ncbi:hypothetical protein O6H91_09G047400 [Diphasiastrum complanatum]|uniref:Uncharacterized protein n=1 Tax=Diphasiastrum complanatum TaxID=34168 RepID=A0ACC2CNV7_DIPCM|nr:hypothetical protein O6H91_09G047400 [Diphasiastrum complanatum]
MGENQNRNTGNNPVAVMNQFPPAAQPEVMRAAEKDEHYISHLCDACYNAFRHAFGTRLAVAYQSQTKLAGRVLYYLLTTGAGLQTLGEEYCDISQVAVSTQLPASPARRLLLVFYHTVLPYVLDRLSSRAAARGMMLANQSLYEESLPNNNPSTSMQRDSSTNDHVSYSQQSQASRMPSSIQDPSIIEMSYQSLQTNNTYSARRVRESVSMQRFHSAWVLGLQHWSLILPSVKEAFLLLFRANLMLFYFDGIYYHLAKRAAGIRYIFMGKATQQRPRYQLLGVFLLIQLCIVGGDWLRRSILQPVATSMRSRSLDPSFTTTGAQGVVVLDEDGNRILEKSLSKEQSEWSFTDKGVDMEISPSKCPLCLSPRQHPTATSCGHVFCWTCIVEWCNEKPECPLCRSPVSHSDLVCVYHADF